MSLTSKKSPQKSTQFANQEEVFTFEEDRTEEQNNQLLLTPNSFDLQFQERNKPRANDKMEDPVFISCVNTGIQDKRKTILLKRQQFIKRVLQPPANNKEMSIQAPQIENIPTFVQNGITKNNNEKKQENGATRVQKNNEGMDIEEKNKRTEQIHQSHENTKKQVSVLAPQIIKNQLISSKLGQEQNQSNYNINQTKLKHEHLSNIDNQRKSNEDNQTKSSFKKQINVQKRVTLGPESFLKKLGIEKDRKSLTSNQYPQNGVENSSPHETLVTQALRRLSGGSSNIQKLKRKSRVTLDFKQFSNMLTVNDLDQNNHFLDILKKQKTNHVLSEKEQKQKQICKARRQFLEEYVESSNSRRSTALQSIRTVTQKNQQLLRNIEKINQLEKSVRDLLQNKQSKFNEKALKLQKRTKQIHSTDQMLALMEPIYYIESVYGVKILSVQQNNRSLQFTKDYLIDFVIDGNFYCKIKSKEGQDPSITIKPNTVLQNTQASQTMDSQMRKSLLQIYFSQRLIKLQPVKTLIKLGEYYKQIHKIQKDLQMIHSIFDLQELNLNAKKQLLFKIRIDFSLAIEVTINLVEYLQSGHYSIKSISSTEQLKHESAGKEPFLQFLSAVLERIQQ